VVDLGLIPPVFAFLGLAAMGPARPSSLASLAGAFLLALLGAAREGLPDRPPAVQLWAGFGPALVVAAAFATWDRGRRFLLGCAAAVLLILGGLGIPRRAHGLREIDPRVLGAWSLGMRSRPDLASFLRCGALPSEFQGPCRRGLVARLGWAAAPPLLSRTDGVTEALLGLLPQTVPDAAEPEWRREVFFGFGLRVAWPLRGGVQEGLPRCRLDPGIGLDHRDWCEIAVAWSRVRDGLTDHELLADLPLVEDGGRPLFARGVGLHARGILRPEAVVGRCRRVLPPKWQDLCARGAAQWSRPFAAPPRP
jgi:hypothetical protein